jgi:hypothetical protein
MPSFLHPLTPQSTAPVMVTVYVAHGKTMHQFKLDIHSLIKVCQCLVCLYLNQDTWPDQ